MNFETEVYKYINYLSINRLKCTTIKNIKLKFKNHIIPFFGSKNIDDITCDDILKWQKYIIDLHYSPGFENSIQSALEGFFKYLEKRYNVKNIFSQVGRFKTYYNKNTQKKESTLWSKNDFKKFIKKVDDPIYHAFFNVLFLTGVRKSEAMALTFNDFDKKYIYIDFSLTKERYGGQRQRLRPKTKESIRKIRIDYAMYLEIKRLQNYYITKYGYFNSDFYIFGGIKPIATTTLDRKRDLYCKKAGVKRIRIHDFRHAHATILYRKGIPIKIIQQRLGHADISTTMNTYVHSDFKDEKRVLTQLFLLRF